MQEKNSSIFVIKRDVASLNENFRKLEKELSNTKKELADSKALNQNLSQRIVSIEKKAHANEQYSRKEYMEVSGIPDTVEASFLENTVTQVFRKIGVTNQPE